VHLQIFVRTVFIVNIWHITSHRELCPVGKDRDDFLSPDVKITQPIIGLYIRKMTPATMKIFNIFFNKKQKRKENKAKQKK
jgi:hypothetical protein